MSTEILLTGIILLVLALCALALCLRAVLHLRAWHKVRRPDMAHYRKTLIPCLAAVIILTGCLTFLAWGGRPVPERRLLQVSGTVSRIERHSALVSPGGYGLSCCFVELENGERLYFPDGYPFDTAAFLAAAERQSVAFRYAPVHGRSQVFEIQTAGGVYLSYADGCAGAWRSTVLALAGVAVLFLWLAGLALRFPIALYREADELLIEQSERRRGFARQIVITIAGIAALILLTGFFKPRVTETPACTAFPLTQQVTLELNGAWRAYGVSESGIQWYRIQEGASTCFHGYALSTPESEGVSRREWAEYYLASQRDYLREDFIGAPDPAFGPFLEELQTAPPTAGGVEYLWSEGMAKSTGGSWNHFLLVLMPEQGCMLMIHSSSWAMEPEELEAYAAAWVWSIPAGLRTGM